jgi:hypothetical protein
MGLAMLVLLAAAAWSWFGAGHVADGRVEREAALPPPGGPVRVATVSAPVPAPMQPVAQAPAAAPVSSAQPVVAGPEVGAGLPGRAGSAPVPRETAAVPLAKATAAASMPSAASAPLSAPLSAPRAAPPLPELAPRAPAALAAADPPAPARAKPIASARVDAPTTEAASPTVPWPDAALEAIAQAQRLWNSGAREAALEFLGAALAGIERTHGVELALPGAGASAALAMLRELVRMETVQARPAAVLAVLKRYERLSGGQADLWAVRGNAAQRLSHHAEAVQAYLTALKIRPGEGRWMLGAAVSLAAQGQTGAAAEFVEQARAVGVPSPEVLSYLRQLGVQVRER